MTALRFCFWVSVSWVAYAYGIYPLVMAAASVMRNRAPHCRARFRGSVTIVLAVRNEEAVVARRVRELVSQISDANVDGEVIVVSDGSSDGTAAQARAVAGSVARVLETSQHVGKAAALNRGCSASKADVIVFADARQTWEHQTLALLLENLADPKIGAVGGELILEQAEGAIRGVGLYWRYEKWLRRAESAVHSTVGLSGSISAVRRRLFVPIPSWTLLDDVYWPLRVVMQGFRVVHDDRAVAHDRLPQAAADEMRRKTRTLSGNFQLLVRLPKSLSPFHNPIWWQWVSHKLMRLGVPWALLLMLISSGLLDGYLYRAAFWVQIVGYGICLTGFRNGASRISSACSSFLLLNVAAWLAFWVWISGGCERAWRTTVYANPLLHQELTE